MIKINLLPIEFRQVEVKRKSFNLQTIFIASFFICLLIALIQIFVFIGVRSRLNQLNLDAAKFLEPSKQSDELNQNINSKLLPQKKFLESNILPSFLVAELMNVLSDALPESLWLSDLTIRRERDMVRLELTGYSRITSKQIAVAQIQEYVNLAKEKMEAVFQKNLKDDKTQIEVKAVLTTSLKEFSGVEVMQFSSSFRSISNPRAK